MSVRVMTAAFDYSESRGSDRLVLLVIADRSDDDGTGCYRGKESIAQMARVSRSTVTESIKRLEALGELVVEHRSGRTSEYRIVLPGVGEPGRILADRQTASIGDPADGSATPSADTRLPVRPRSIPKPSIEPSSDRASALVAQVSRIADKARARDQRETAAKDAVKADADRVARAFWESQDPRPLTPFLGVRKIIETALRARWSADEIAAALPECDTLATWKLEQVLKRRRPAPRSSDRTGNWNLA